MFLTFDPTSGCVKTEYVLAFCFIRHSLKFDMQHYHVLKKLNFDLLTPPPMGGGGGGGGRLFACEISVKVELLPNLNI